MMETEKRIDVSQWFKGPVFEPLEDLKLFKKFFIEAGTLAGRTVSISLPRRCTLRVIRQTRSMTKGRS